MGPRYVHAAAASFAIALPVAQISRLLCRWLVGQAHFLSLIGISTMLTTVSAAFAAAAGTAAMVKAFELPVGSFWRRMTLMAMAPLLPCAFFSVRYERAADPFAAWWSEALGLLLAILTGLQTGYQETAAPEA